MRRAATFRAVLMAHAERLDITCAGSTPESQPVVVFNKVIIFAL
jgi:hypothetical protein